MEDFLPELKIVYAEMVLFYMGKIIELKKERFVSEYVVEYCEGRCDYLTKRISESCNSGIEKLTEK